MQNVKIIDYGMMDDQQAEVKWEREKSSSVLRSSRGTRVAAGSAQWVDIDYTDLSEDEGASEGPGLQRGEFEERGRAQHSHYKHTRSM